MGSALTKFNDMKRSVNNKMAMIKGEEPELGYLGAPPAKFPKTVCPPGCKNLDVKNTGGKIPEVYKVNIYECLDEFKNDGSYRFSGIEFSWRCKMTGNSGRSEQMVGEKDGCRTIEVGALDYIKKITFCTKEHLGQQYISFVGIQSHLAEPAAVGDLKVPVKDLVSTNTEFTEGLQGVRLVMHKKLKMIVDIIPVFARVADKKTKVDETRKMVQHSFLTSYKDVQAIWGTKIYNYKAPENRYEDFSSFVTNGKMREEYLGGLPIRFLSPEETARWNSLKDKLGLQPLVDLLAKKGSLYHLDMDKSIEDKVVNFVVAVLESELFNQDGGNYENNIRFCMKMLCIVYNDDANIWKRIKTKVEENYKKIGGSLFDKAIQTCLADDNLKEVQKIENSHDEEVKQKYQKACPQCPDDGKDDDVEKVAKKYMMDAAQFLQEFHAFFQTMFDKKGAHYHGAPTVKGLDRVKAKAQEYQEKEKLNASDAIARTMDYLRGTVMCKNLHEVIMTFNKLKKLKGDFKIVRVKNGFKDMTEKSYKSILLNIMVYNTQIAEVQITIDAFKEGNDINHFIYEVIREHNLYDMVAKNLNLSTAFKEWVEPLAPDSMHEIWPKNRSIHLKGFCQEGGDDFWSMFEDKSKRYYSTMNLTTDKDYKLSGFFGWPGCNYKLIEAQSKVKFPTKISDIGKNVGNKITNAIGGKKISEALGVDKALADAGATGESTIEWRMLPYGSMTREVGIFKGRFLDDQIIEGEFRFKPCDNFGNEIANPPSSMLYAEKKGKFRFWVDDAELPGLNTTTLAFRDVMKHSRVIRKKFIPHKEMEWKGVLGGSKKGADEALALKLKITNPENFPYEMVIRGKGNCGAKKIQTLAGYHMHYDSVRLNLILALGFSYSGPRNIICHGRFTEDLKIMGTYDEKGHFGRFNIECTDKEALKKFGPRSESDNGRWDFIIIYNDGQKQYNQATMKINPDNTVSGTGFNFDGNFQIEGKAYKKGINFTRTQKNANGTTEILTFDGMFITGGVYEGQFRSDNDWGKFKLKAC